MAGYDLQAVVMLVIVRRAAKDSEEGCTDREERWA